MSATKNGMLVMTLLIAGIAVVGVLRRLHPISFLNGTPTGVLGILPLGMGWFVYLSCRRMAEPRQWVQEWAAASTCLLSMAGMAGFVVAQTAIISVPLWTLCGYGGGVLPQKPGDWQRGDQ